MSNSLQLKTSKSGDLTLTVGKSKEMFYNLIKSTLGSSEKITRQFVGRFKIKYEDIEKINSVLLERVDQQNSGCLIETKVTVYDSNNLAYTHNSLEYFKNYNEIRPGIAKAIKIIWSFLIQFNGKEFDERQDIELFFSVDEKATEFFSEHERSSKHHGMFRLTITYTSNSWASDIEHLLSQCIENLEIKEGKVRNFYKKNRIWIQIFSSIIIFIFFFTPSAYQLAKSNLKQYENFINQVKNYNLSDKMDKIIEMVVYNGTPDMTLTVVITIIFFIILSIAMTALLLRPFYLIHNSFLILTKSSKMEAIRLNKKYNRDWLMFYLSIIAAILINCLTSAYFKFIGIYLT